MSAKVSWLQFDTLANPVDVKVSWVQFDTVADPCDVKVSWVQFDTNSGESWREFEVSLEPAWKKALRKRNKPARFSSGKSRRKAHQVEIRAAKSIVNTPDINENKILSLYAEWLSFQPIISEDNTGDNAYSTFLEMVGRLLEEWENEEDEAILLLLG